MYFIQEVEIYNGIPELFRQDVIHSLIDGDFGDEMWIHLLTQAQLNIL